jgi:mRNA-degrading endonuclease RelE of RelBE toxin-antitoxin system
MADYAITFARSARKELENLPADTGDRILRKVETLAVDPRLLRFAGNGTARRFSIPN